MHVADLMASVVAQLIVHVAKKSVLQHNNLVIFLVVVTLVNLIHFYSTSRVKKVNYKFSIDILDTMRFLHVSMKLSTGVTFQLFQVEYCLINSGFQIE